MEFIARERQLVQIWKNELPGDELNLVEVGAVRDNLEHTADSTKNTA